MAEPLVIVPVDEIPKAKDALLDDLMSLFRLAAKMEPICDKEKGIGLSAVQVGVPLNFFIIKVGRNFEYFVNCEYEGIGDKQKSIEGCLSLKKDDGSFRRFEVDRFSAIKLTGKELKITNTPSVVLEDVSRLETGLRAIVLQHEIDHGNDILISQIGKEIELVM